MIRTKLSSSSPPRPGRGGFALVVTLSLMVLLAMIAVGLLGLSSLALRGAAGDRAQAEARANARMALTLAIGDLQLELGPDQRVNAPADLVTGPTGAGRERWVGTWDSWTAGSIGRPTPSFRRWLVSGTPENLADPAFPAQPSSSAGLVPLLKDGGSVRLSAPRVAMTGGAFAYAVGDENSKARIGPAQDVTGQDLAEHLARWQSAMTDPRSLPGLDGMERNDPRLDRLMTDETVRLVADASGTGSRSHTVWSEGLLTNVRDGGLRKDLSLLFHDPASGSKTNALYEVNGRRGINFNELRKFHEVPARLTYNPSGLNHPDGGALNRDIPFMVGLSAKRPAAENEHFVYLRPVVLRASWYVSAWAERVGPDDNPRYQIFIVLEPIIWLWNPFDVNLVMQPRGHLTLRCWGLPYNIIIEHGANRVTRPFNQIRTTGTNQNISIEIGQTVPVVMRPGEVLVYSRGREAAEPTKSFGRFEARLGWSTTGGLALFTGVEVDGSTPVTLSMETSNQRGGTSWGLIQFHSYVGDDPEGGGTERFWYGGHTIDRSGWGGALAATDFPPEMFANVPPRTFDSAANLTGQPQPLAVFSYRARTESEGFLRSRLFARLKPGSLGYDHQAVDSATLHAMPYEPHMQAVSGGLDRGFDFDGGKGFFGGSYFADTGKSYIVNHSIPRERPSSLGAFQHAIANGVEYQFFTSPPGSGNFHTRILQPPISHPIGNSFAPSCIAPDAFSGSFNSMDAADHSWLANNALWDQWFVSSLAERAAPHHLPEDSGNARQLFERFSASNGSARPLPNRHLTYAGGDPAADLNALFNGSAPRADAHQKVAAIMRVHGAFNVNSTDPEAWLALLRSTGGFEIPVEAAAGTSTTWQSSNAPFAGLLVPKGPAIETNQLGTASTPAQWIGYRDASDEELEAFAEALVEEVRKRGPFLSLADFINRRIDPDPDLALSGALQAALDRTINETLETGNRSVSDGPSGIPFPQAEQGSRVTHVPGHVKQGDVLTGIGNRLTPRSDTFTVRALGESRAADGRILATARCEAVIQRVAGYVDPVNTPETPPALAHQINQRFGRSFEVVAFRWLATDEP